MQLAVCGVTVLRFIGHLLKYDNAEIVDLILEWLVDGHGFIY